MAQRVESTAARPVRCEPTLVFMTMAAPCVLDRPTTLFSREENIDADRRGEFSSADTSFRPRRMMGLDARYPTELLRAMPASTPALGFGVRL
jgi:hypothetical protein